MERPKKKCINNEQERHNMTIKVGGNGGIGVVIVWGGALAVATLASLSAIKFKKMRSTTKTISPPPPPLPPPIESTNISPPPPTTTTIPPPPPPPPLAFNNSKDGGSEGLRALVQQPSPMHHHHHRASSDGSKNLGTTQIDSASIFAETQNLNNNQKENSTFGDPNTILSDDQKPESRELSMDHDSLKPEKAKQDLLVSEKIEVASDDKAIEATDADHQIEEEKKEKEEGNGGGENVVEKGVNVETADQAEEAVGEKDPQSQLNGEEETMEKRVAVEMDPIAEQVMSDDKAMEATGADQIEVEGSPPLQYVGEEEDGEGENVVEKGVEQVPKAQLNEKVDDNDEDERKDGEDAMEKCVTVEDGDGENVAEKEVEQVPKAQLIQEEKEDDSDEDHERKEEEDAMEKCVTVETVEVDKSAVEEKSPAKFSQKEEEENVEDIVEKGVTVETAKPDLIAIEDESQPQLSEEEEEEEEISDESNIYDDDEEEYIVETGEESSEGTGDSSMESNAEAIWPAESMQELSQEIKKLGEKIEEETTFEYEKKNEISEVYDDDGHNESKEIVKSTTASIKRGQSEALRVINQPKDSFYLRIWIWSMVVLMLLLVAPLLLSLTQIEHENSHMFEKLW